MPEAGELQDGQPRCGPGLRPGHLRHRPLQPGVQTTQKPKTSQGVSTYEGQQQLIEHFSLLIRCF